MGALGRPTMPRAVVPGPSNQRSWRLATRVLRRSTASSAMPQPNAEAPESVTPKVPAFERFLTGKEFLIGLVVVGVLLRLWAYASNTSLILDEILLARNILEVPLKVLLTQPLEHAQVAPRGFLLVERVIVRLFGGGEHALRLFPFLCSLAGLVLFRQLAQRSLTGLGVPFALALYAIGIPFLKYAAEVKQYGIDATVAIALTLIALELQQREVSRRTLLLAGLAGFGLSWFSQASVLAMGGLGLALVANWLLTRERRLWAAVTTTVPIWAVSSVMALLVGIFSMAPATRDYMYDFWRRGFLPLPLNAKSDLRWAVESALGFFTDVRLLNYPLPWLYVAAAAVGLVALWRSRRDVAILLGAPIAVTLLAAVAHQYPFRSRLLLFLVPGLLLLISSGAEWMRLAVGRLRPALGAVVMGLLLIPPVAVLSIAPPPYEVENYLPMLSYVQKHRQPGDVLFVLPPMREGMQFYGRRFGIEPSEVTVSICERVESRPYLRDVDRFRGKSRLWFLSWSGGTYGTPRAALHRYLGTIGVKRDSLRLKSMGRASTDIDMYDLSDTTRLKAATAETFPAPPLPTASPRPWCGRGTRADSSAAPSPS